ncbi:MAG: YybH family protein [Gemmatimonadaceae bacterium]
MRLALRIAIAALCGAAAACAQPARNAEVGADAASASAAIDALNARLSDAYRRRDPQAYAALYTDAAVFEWPAIPPVRGPAALAGMARDIWAAERDVELRLDVATRHIARDHASEFGAFRQTWTDTAGVRRTEFGRYATLFVRGTDGTWRMERWLGFEDSVSVTPVTR